VGQVPYLYPPGTGWLSYTLRHWFPFPRLLRLVALRWRCSNPPPQGPNSTRVKVTLRLDRTTSLRYMAPARTSQKSSLPLFHVLSLPGKRVHRALPYQWLLYCRLFTQRLLGNGSTCHSILRCVRNLSLPAQNVACFRFTVTLSKDHCSVRTAFICDRQMNSDRDLAIPLGGCSNEPSSILFISRFSVGSLYHSLINSERLFQHMKICPPISLYYVFTKKGKVAPCA
jgi:hypothetical protein